MNKISLVLEPAFENVDCARAAIEGFCKGFFGKDAAGIRDFSLAAVEAMNNAVEHSGAVCIRLELAADRQSAVIKLITTGKKFDPTKKRPLPALDGKELPEGGFGLSVIRRLSDGLSYEYSNGENVLTIRKKFRRRAIGG